MVYPDHHVNNRDEKMIAPDELQTRLQRWADANYKTRGLAAKDLSEAIGCNRNSARAYIEYQIPQTAYETVYKIWGFLNSEFGDE